jgi:putative membrane protein
MTSQVRKPRAISLDAVHVEGREPKENRVSHRKPRAIDAVPELVMTPDEAVDADVIAPVSPDIAPPARGFGWGGLFLAASSAILALAAGLAVDQLIRDMFARNDWLGWLTAGLAALAALAAIAMATRELWGLMRLRTISRLRDRAQAAHDGDDQRAARAVIAELETLYAARPDTAHGRATLAAQSVEIVDGSDLINLVERDLLTPLDLRARTMVMDSAKRVSIVTAISPRALVDLAFVLMENLRLIRRISTLYGGRPGTIGFWRLTRNVVAHLAATGAIAIGDGLVQQLVGHGLAARLSARLGEGVINGMLTARIGISAIDLCRPVPFINSSRPGIAEFIGELARIDGLQKTSGSESFPAPGAGVATKRNMK